MFRISFALLDRNDEAEDRLEEREWIHSSGWVERDRLGSDGGVNSRIETGLFVIEKQRREGSMLERVDDQMS